MSRVATILGVLVVLRGGPTGENGLYGFQNGLSRHPMRMWDACFWFLVNVQVVGRKQANRHRNGLRHSSQA